MQTRGLKLLEFFILFALLPISYSLDYDIWLKVVFTLVGFGYVVFVLLFVEQQRFRIQKELNWPFFWRRVLIQLLVIAAITAVFVFVTDKELLFSVVKSNPKKWLLFLLIYSFLSVYPQELIYRTFFFARYQEFFRSTKQLIFVNAVFFSMAHFFFEANRSLVLGLTFLGGLLFAYTFTKTRSTLMVSVEHAIYGCWLYTVGMGGMLGFPS